MYRAGTIMETKIMRRYFPIASRDDVEKISVSGRKYFASQRNLQVHDEIPAASARVEHRFGGQIVEPIGNRSRHGAAVQSHEEPASNALGRTLQRQDVGYRLELPTTAPL